MATRIRYELLDLLSGLRGRTGMTTLLTTHYLDEAERLCDRIAVMHQGTIVALDRRPRYWPGWAPSWSSCGWTRIPTARWPRCAPAAWPPATRSPSARR
jgi:energy-coupling factor transporter ATP-binding protein EcfA2